MRYFFGSNVKVQISVQTNLSVYGLACNGFIGGHGRVFSTYSGCRRNLRVKLSSWSFFHVRVKKVVP